MQHYSKIAGLFVYPQKEVLVRTILDIYEILNKDYPSVSGDLKEFSAFVDANSNDSLREYYVKTFDVSASCYLDIGYVLFGEDYKRGQFLVNMLSEHKLAGNDCGTELPDHLPNMLNLLPKIKDQAMAEELAYSIMIPALREMLKKFIDETNVYKKVVKLLVDVMELNFKHLTLKQFELLDKDKTNFLNNINCGN